jgi:hypothetical protein
MRAGIYDAFDGYQDLHVEVLFIGNLGSLLRMSLMHTALCDVIKVKGSKSIQIVRSQSCNGVITKRLSPVATSRTVGTVWAAAGVQARSPRRKQDVHRIARSIFVIDFHRRRSLLHWHVHQLDRRDHAFALAHESLQRAASDR